MLLSPDRTGLEGGANEGGFGIERYRGELAHAYFVDGELSVFWEHVVWEVEDAFDGLFSSFENNGSWSAKLRYVGKTGDGFDVIKIRGN